LKKLLAIIVLISAVQFVKADQLQWITKEQAEKTVQFIRDNEISQVILWCACCDNDQKLLVNISKISYRPASDPQYYEVVIKGFFYNGGNFNEDVDLAYVHIQKGTKWYCLGKELEFECDPCTKPFKF
jgi:hypothetical protein